MYNAGNIYTAKGEGKFGDAKLAEVSMSNPYISDLTLQIRLRSHQCWL